MKKFTWILFSLLTIAVSVNAQEFSSTKGKFVKVAKAQTFGAMYQGTSLGVALVNYNTFDNEYSLLFGTDNRFDEPMHFTFETKDELVNTLRTLLQVAEDNDKGDFSFPDGSTTFIYSAKAPMPCIYIKKSGFAGDGYIPKTALRKLISKVSSFEVK